MPYFPQLATGAMGQYPLAKKRLSRTVVNESGDGRRIKLADAGAVGTEWRLTFEELTDGEMDTLRSFFEGVEGRLGTFTFLDPAGNLLAWSEQLDAAVWEKGPLVTVAEAGDPGAWLVTNGSGTTAELVQTIEAPAWFCYCFSLFARGAAGSGVTLVCGETRAAQGLGPERKRLAVTGQGQGNGETVRIGLELQPGAWVEVFGPQAEAQMGASTYKRTLSRGGVYENARLDNDELVVTTAGPGRHRCELTVIHGERI